MYNAHITQIRNVRKHSNADRLQIGECFGNQVVVGLDTMEGDFGIYFPIDGQLSEEYCHANNLFSDSTRNADPTQKGYFDLKRRVRAQKFRGEKSEGLFMPIGSLAYAGVEAVEPGLAFCEIMGHPICNKYETEKTRNVGSANRTSARRGETIQFKKHMETDQFRFYWDQIPAGSLVTVTEKLHGTSGRYGKVLEVTPRPWWKRIFDFLLGDGDCADHNWIYLNGSKNVIVENSNTRNSFYGTDEFRLKATEGINLRKGEVIYFELVGWVNENTPIMPPHSPGKELPEVAKMFGPVVHYHYGQPKGTTGLYVYRIVQTNEEGDQVELSWAQVKKRCSELGINHVPEISPSSIMLTADDRLNLKNWVEMQTEFKSSNVDSSQFREGVVVRIDDPNGKTYFLKNKSFAFGVMEGYIKTDDAYVDTEEVA